MPMNALLHQQDHFLACAGDLIRLSSILRQREPSTPLIINIPGVICATEFDVLLQILRQIKPQRVVYLADLQSIDEETAAKLDALDVGARKTGGVVSQISAQGNLNAPSRTDSELRGMHMLSYFHCTGLAKSGPRHFTFSSNPLSHEVPWEFCYDETSQSQQDFIGFLMLSEWVDASQILTALNGSIIQIVETNEAAVQEQYGVLPRTGKFRIPYFRKSATGAVEPLNPMTSQLVCNALIRGWDPERRVVQLVVPKTHEGLLQNLKPEKTVFVFGCCETPEWAYTEDAYYQLSQQTQSGEVDEKTAAHGIKLPPWVARGPLVDNMGYMNVPRRVRKFQQ